ERGDVVEQRRWRPAPVVAELEHDPPERRRRDHRLDGAGGDRHDGYGGALGKAVSLGRSPAPVNVASGTRRRRPPGQSCGWPWSHPGGTLPGSRTSARVAHRSAAVTEPTNEAR